MRCSAISRAATAKLAASTTSAWAGPIAATSSPPTAAPVMPASRSTVLASPVARSIGTPEASTSTGTRACLAPSPGPRSAPATATSSISSGNDIAPPAYSAGIEPTASTLARSAETLTRRAPKRSITGPPSALAVTYGAISAKATRPVWVALPVVVRTNQGIAIIDNRVPVSETASAPSHPISGARRFMSAPRR